MNDIPIKLAVNQKQMDEWRKIMGRVATSDEINGAVAQAINRALENVKTVTVKGLTSQYAVKRATVAAAQKIRTANKRDLGGEVRYTGKAVPLEDFKLKPSKIQSWKGKTVSARPQLAVEIKKGETKPYAHAFLQQIYGDKPRVYARVPGKKVEGFPGFPVKIQRGPAVAGMLEESGIAAEAQTSGNETLAKRIDHEISRMLTK